jgi:predicted branched-subunit amino acid permease
VQRIAPGPAGCVLHRRGTRLTANEDQTGAGASEEGHSVRSLLPAAAPLAAAIAVFGTIYGAGATAVASPSETIASSLVVFSGAVQFATVALSIAGASSTAILTTAAMLNARHLLLGAALRPKLGQSLPRRAALAWWLSDETAGLALASGAKAGRVLAISGALFYAAWAIGTTIGVLGASLAPLHGVAAAMFPVLFVGLAALSSTERVAVYRSAAAALLSVAVAVAAPQIRDLAPAIVAIAVALPESRR